MEWILGALVIAAGIIIVAIAVFIAAAIISVAVSKLREEHQKGTRK